MPVSSDSFSQFLRESALFSALPDEDLSPIANALVMVELPSGEVLFEEGEEVDGLFLVETGKLIGFDQDRQFSRPYQRGDILGLANNSSGNQRQETIQAQTNSRVWFISGANIEQLSADRPEFAETLTVLANSQMMIRRAQERGNDQCPYDCGSRVKQQPCRGDNSA